METMRDIKRRINSIKNTQKITKAMKMVAAAKLKKSEEKAEAARPFFKKTKSILADVVRYTKDASEHPLFAELDGNKYLYIILSADRGLCGPYNAKVIDKLEKSISKDADIYLMTIGRKARDYFKRREYNIISEYLQLADYPDFSLARKIASEVISFYEEGIINKVTLIYTHYDSPLNQTVKAFSLLPVDMSEVEKKEENRVDYLYEPGPAEVLDLLLPKYVHNILYSALLESKASEFGSRMTAMDAATDNAGEIIDNLTLSYNRARQAAITKEITEIIGGAEALK